MSVATGKIFFHYKLPIAQLNADRVDVDCKGAWRHHDMRPPGVPMQFHWFCMEGKENTPLRTIHKTKLDMLRYVQRQVDLMREILMDILPLSDGNRGKRSWWSRGWSAVTGLAEDDQVQDMQATIDKLSEGVAAAADAWKEGSSTFLGAVKVQSQRVDALTELATAQRNSFIQFHAEIMANYTHRNLRMKLGG